MTYESLHLIIQALKLGTRFSSKTSIHQVKRYLEGLSSFAENTKTRLESPALTAVHEAVLNSQRARNFHIQGMASAPVTNELKESPIVHGDKHLFPELYLKKADSLASQHFKEFKPAYGSSTRIPQTRTFVLLLGAVSLSHPLGHMIPELSPHIGVDIHRLPTPTPISLTRNTSTSLLPQPLPPSGAGLLFPPEAGHK